MVKFVAKLSRSGTKLLINIPSEKKREIDDTFEYFKVYLIPVRFDDKLD